MVTMIETGSGPGTGPVARGAQLAQDVRAGATRQFARARTRWPLLELAVVVLVRWRRANGSMMAGHIAYRMVLFLVPLVLFAVALMGFKASSAEVRQQAEEQFGIGRALASTVADASSQADDSRVQLLAVAGFGATLTAWSLLSALQVAVAAIWGVEAKFESRLRSLAKFVGFFLLLLGASALRQALTRSGVVLTAVGAVLSCAVTALSVFGLTWMLPRRTSRLSDLLPGAVVAGVGVTALNMAGGWYFASKLQRSAELYGTVGIVVTTMLYVFVAAEVLVVAVVVDTVWCDRDELVNRAGTGDVAAGGAPAAG
jgi:YihY family inner membrane protein